MYALDVTRLFGDRYPFASFHDAKFRSISADYEERTLEVKCLLWVGDLDAPPGPEREMTARGVLLFSGLLYFAVEPPENHASFEEGPLDITSDGSWASRDLPASIPNLPQDMDDDAFVHWFYASNLDAFLVVAAKQAVFAWDHQ